MIRLFVIEDHPVIVSGLQKIFDPVKDEIEITLTASDIDEAIRKANKSLFDLIILDLYLPTGDPVENFKKLNKTVPAIPIIIYTQEKSFQWQRRMYHEGIKGYIVKSAKEEEIRSTVKKVMNGKLVYTELMQQYMASESKVRFANTKYGLKPDEQEISRLLTDGIEPKNIAKKMKVSLSSVEKKLKHIRELFDAKNNIELVKILLFTKD